MLPEAKAVYPSSSIELPKVSFDFYVPDILLADMEEPELPFYDICETFCARDINHVASKDSRLFTTDDILLIDLWRLQRQNYSFPLRGAKMISPYMGRRKNHSGVDLKTFAGDTIRAAFDGVVRMAKGYAAYGNVIVIRHYNGLETVYSHNSKHLVKQGDKVKASQPIALTGRTGRASTEHLHFETRINGQHFNPELIFDMKTEALKDNSLYCILNNGRLNISSVDAFPYQQPIFRKESN